MRLLMTTDPVGGVWTYTREMTEGLLQRGCAIALVSFGRLPSPPQRLWAEELRGRWGEAFHYQALNAPLEWMQENAATWRDSAAPLLRIVEAFAPDLLHCNQFCFGALPLHLPKVVVAHSDVLSWARACREDGLAPSPWLDRYRSLVAEGLAGADAVIAPTRWMMDALAAGFPLRSAGYVIPNGRTLPPALLPFSRELRAVSAGRLWDEAKNIKLLADVRSLVPILIAGETEHELAKAPAGMIGNAEVLGWLEEERLLALFRQSALYLSTSLYEPFGLAPLEAALCGCAIAAYDIPSLREVWGDAALFFDDAPSLQALLAQLAASPRQLAAAQSRSLARARQFTAACMTEAYLALFHRILNSEAANSQIPAYATRGEGVPAHVT